MDLFQRSNNKIDNIFDNNNKKWDEEVLLSYLQMGKQYQFLLAKLIRGPSGKILLGRLPPFIGRASIRIPHHA